MRAVYIDIRDRFEGLWPFGGPRGTPNGHSPSNGYAPRDEGRGPYPPPNNGEAPPRFLTPADVPNGPTGGFRGV